MRNNALNLLHLWQFINNQHKTTIHRRAVYNILSILAS